MLCASVAGAEPAKGAEQLDVKLCNLGDLLGYVLVARTLP